MAGSLEGPLAKLRRAQRQAVLLQEEMSEVWAPRNRWPVRAEEHRAGLEYRFYLGELPSIDPDWPLWAGEILFDLRSALDHLAYELHVRRFRGQVPSRVESTTMFPITRSPGDFPDWRIKNLSQRDRRAIKHLQPYVTRNDSYSRTRHWLNKLDALHIADKHRKLHVVAASQNRAPLPQFPPDIGFESDPIFGPHESHSHVETWTFTKPPPEMQDHRGAEVEITLEAEGEWVDLGLFLRRTTAAVRTVLHRFASRFPEIEGAFAIELPAWLAERMEAQGFSTET